MNLNVFYGILIPFIGTSAGAACVFFMKKRVARVGADYNIFVTLKNGGLL